MGLALRLFVVGVLLLLVPPLVETAALPVGSATDGNSVRLVDGDAGSVFDGDSFNNDNGAGSNVDAVYTMGDSDNPSESHSLRVVNYGDEARGATVNYEGFDNLGDPGVQVRFSFYDGGTKVAEVTDEDPSARIRMEPNDSVYVVTVVDTRGVSPDIDLGGELRLSLHGSVGR